MHRILTGATNRLMHASLHYLNTWLMLTIIVFSSLLAACAPQPPKPSTGHINTEQAPAVDPADIPPPITHKPYIPPPLPMPPQATFSVLVSNVPVQELLFALARDANINLDVHSGVSGYVTLNAINQTIPQILARIARQIDMRYEFDGTLLTLKPDRPYLRTYKISYVNMSRDSRSDVTVATQIASTGTTEVGEGQAASTEGNNSSTQIQNTSNNRFWITLQENIQALLASLVGEGIDSIEDLNEQVIVNPETGLITVHATHRQHLEIQKFLDSILNSALRQVLIEATIVEVTLNDRYQAGVDWQRIDGDFTYGQTVTDASLGAAPFYNIGYSNPDSILGNISASVRMLEQFGNVKVLSSPKIMALNNQTALLKVVDNLVYFTTDVEITETDTRSREVFETEINTVPVGLVMTITPQISEADMVTLSVRPTISRVINFRADPNPSLAAVNVTNLIPEIQVREIESILKVRNGQIAVIGGLMQDTVEQNTTGVPVLSKLPLVGDVFSYRDDNYKKTELIIFIRPVVVKEASVQHDLQDYRIYLPNPNQPDQTLPSSVNGLVVQ